MRLIGVFLLVACLMGAAQGAIENGSFENGLTGWEATGYDPTTVSEFTANFRMSSEPITIRPIDGDSMAIVKSGGQDNGLNFGQITQTMTFSAGEVLSGYYFFATQDYLRWNDTATITLVPSNSEASSILLAYKDVAAVGDYCSMPDWARFEYAFDASTAGTYQLVIRVEDAYDMILSSYLVVDDLQVVPEPATMGLLAIGALTMLRRKSNKKAQ